MSDANAQTTNSAAPTEQAAQQAQATPPATPPVAKVDEPAQAAPPADAAKPDVKKDEPAAKPDASKEPAKAAELKLPDGSLLTQEQVEKISTYAKEKGLTPDQAQELLNRESESVGSYHSQQMEQYEQLKEAWKTKGLADPEIAGIGGKDYVQNVEFAHRALSKFGTDELKKQLDATGFGNHPEVIRVFSRIGKAMSEGTIDKPNGFTPPAKKSTAEKLYGDTTPKT